MQKSPATAEDFVRKPGATYAYFDIHTFGTCPNCEGGRMVFELFTDSVPKTAENFRFSINLHCFA